jgi:hypothetical protein
MMEVARDEISNSRICTIDSMGGAGELRASEKGMAKSILAAPQIDFDDSIPI